MIFGHIADLHLGYRQYGLKEREEDFYKSALDISRKIRNRGVNATFIVGDLFHSKSIRAETLVQADHIIEELGVVYLVSGNHDNEAWLDYLQKRHDGVVYNKDWITGDMGIKMVGWNDNIDINPLFFDYNILLIHGGVEGWDPNHRISRLTLQQFNNNYQYVALGHIHEPYTSGVAHNPSSLERCAITDKPGGAFIFSTEGDVDFINSINRRFVVVENEDYDVDDAIVYVVTEDVDLEKLKKKALYVKVKVFEKKVKNIKKVNEDDIIREITNLEPEFVKKQFVNPNIGDINELCV